MKQNCILLILIFFTAVSFGQSRLVINNGGYVVMNGGSVTTPLFLVIENNNVTAGAGDGIKRITSGHIISEGEYNKVQWNVGTATGTFTFPLGKSTSAYVPLVVDKTTAGTPSGTGMVRVSSWYTAGNSVWPSGTSLCGTTEGNVADRFWVLDVLNYSANPSATVDFYYNTGEIQAISETDLKMQRWNSSLTGSCKWETPPAGTVNTTSKYVRVSGISSFSPWAMVKQSAPLPVELLGFTAQWKDEEQTSALLQWVTASEINNDYFEIQRSADAITFEATGRVKGKGNSSAANNYEFIDYPKTLDRQPETGVFYRLRQVNYDGSFTFSNIQSLNKEPNAFDIISIYPNPSSGFIDYLIYSSEDFCQAVRVIDANGKIIISEKKLINYGMNKHRINTSHLSRGNYTLQVMGAKSENKQKQFIISR